MRLTRTTSILSLFAFAIGLTITANGQTNSCVPPTHFKQASMLVEAAGVTWNSGGSAQEWIVAWGAAGVTPENMTQRSNTFEPYFIIPLSNAQSQTEAYVKSICGMASSEWVGPIALSDLSKCNNLPVVSGTNDTLCGGGRILLEEPSQNKVIWWYAGIPRAYDSEIRTDSIYSSRTYWMMSTNENGGDQKIGPDYGSQPGGFANFNNSQVITVHDTLLLDSTTLISDAAVSGAIRLLDISGNIIYQERPFFLDSDGAHRVPIRFPLLPGRYRLQILPLPGGGRLFRSSSPQSYPYVLPGLLTIDSTSIGIVNRYYYAYNLSVKSLCTGQIAPAHITVGQQPYSGPDVKDSLCLRDSLFQLNDLLPNLPISNNGYWVRNGMTNPISALDLSKFNPGDQLNLLYITSGTMQCADTAEYRIQLYDCKIGLTENQKDAIVLYPNPAETFVEISIPNDVKLVSITISSMDGKSVKEVESIGTHHQVDIGTLPSGFYIVNLQFENEVIHRRLVIR